MSSKMLPVNDQNWKEDPQYLRDLGLNSPHIRTRERFLALYDITMGKSSSNKQRDRSLPSNGYQLGA